MMKAAQVKGIGLVRFTSGDLTREPDLLAIEEPLEIRLGYGKMGDRKEEVFSVTMRSPGSDEELALGLLFSEGVITSIKDILSIKHCTDKTTAELSPNIIRAEIKPNIKVDLGSGRKQFMNSSCGICGKGSIEELSCISPFEIAENIPLIKADTLTSLIDKQREYQGVFEHTGGLHAVSLFDGNGQIILSREDVGRHNALDKVVGARLLSQALPMLDSILLLSGRAGYEMVQKAVMAGCPVVASIGAPTSLAVETAQNFGVTLIGFLKEQRFNIYTGERRIEI